MAWLTSWNRRKLITVNGSTAGAQSDYQMMLTVNQGSGTDSAGVIYLGGNVLSTFNDLRFTKSDGSTLLNYWIEFITGTSPNQTAKVWIKLAPSPDTIPASPGTYTFYIYYNNSSATAGSNGDNTLIFFDDFNYTAYTNKWDLQSLQSYSTITESGGNLTLSVTGAGSAGSLAGGSIANRITIGNGIELHAKIVSASSNANWTRYSIDFGTGTRNEAYGTCGGATVPYDGYTIYINPPSWNTITLFRVDSGAYTSIGSASIDPNGKYVKMTYAAPNIYVYTSTDNLTWTQQIFSASAPSKAAGKLYLAEYSCGDRGGSIVYDYLFVRKFTSPEPTWGTISTEQTLISLTINSTPTGARIWLAHPSGTGYIDKGVNTNTTISSLESGTYDIKLVLAGYTDWTLTNQNYTTNQTINATLSSTCGTPSCNLIIMSMVSKQLRKPPGYLDLDLISICVENLINR